MPTAPWHDPASRGCGLPAAGPGLSTHPDLRGTKLGAWPGGFTLPCPKMLDQCINFGNNQHQWAFFWCPVDGLEEGRLKNSLVVQFRYVPLAMCTVEGPIENAARAVRGQVPTPGYLPP